MRTMTLLAALLLAMPVLAEEPLTDAELDQITAGGFVIADPAARLAVAAPANVGVFVNNAGQAATLIDRLSIALTTAGFTIVDSSGRRSVLTPPAPANIGIFVNNAGQAETLIDRLSVALKSGGLTVVDTSGRLGVTAGQAPANIAIFVNDSGKARTPGFVTSGFTIVDTSRGLSTQSGRANVGFLVTDTRTLFDTPGIARLVPHGQFAISVK